MAKGDSGASSHYWRDKDRTCLTNIISAPGPTVTLPNNTKIKSSEKGKLPLHSNFSSKATTTAILPGLQSSSLISLGQLCDDNCDVLLNKDSLFVVKNNELLMEGFRNQEDKLWDIPVRNPNILKSNTLTVPTHAGLYSSTKRISKIKKSLRPSSKKIPSTYENIFHTFDDLIDFNECVNLITDQQKLDTQCMNHKLALIIRKNETKHDLATFLTAACFNPVKSTLLRAIKNNHFTTWPGMDEKFMRKHLTPSISSAKGHLNQERQGLQSTKQPLPLFTKPDADIKETLRKLKAKFPNIKDIQDLMEADIASDAFPPSEVPNIKTYDVAYSLVTLPPKNTAYTDLTGRFPYRSSSGNEYILVGYHFDGNVILGEPIKNRQAQTITTAWDKLNSKFVIAGMQPNTYVLDNEVSDLLITAMHKENITFQLVPPHIHRANLAERAIQTYKNHFKAGLATVDPDFPLAEWDRLIPQANITLNLLRASRINPRLSAYAYLFGEFNYNKTPIAPPGTKILAHAKPTNRSSWAPHGDEGWYVGPSMHHYRCVNCYFPKTRSQRDVDTVTFFPKVVPFPEVKTDDFLKQAALDIISILTTPRSSTTVTLEAGDATKNALLKIAEALQRVEDLPKLASPPTPTTPSPPSVPVQLPRVAVPETKQWTKGAEPFQQVRYNLRKVPNKPTNFKDKAAKYLLAQHIFAKHSAAHVFNDNGQKETINTLLFGHDSAVWTKSMSNELGRLAQGNIYGVKATDTIDFIFKGDVPANKAVTYANFVCDFKPLKSEMYRIRLVAGGDKLNYAGDPGAPAASLLETKLMINSVISDAKHGAKFMSCDLKDFFLATPMLNAEYMRIHYKYIPQDIRDMYDLDTKLAADGHIYIKIKKGIYGLKQAAVLAYDNLVKNLSSHGYSPIPHTIGIWQHATRRTKFCLCVDDFGVKYFTKQDADHLLQALGQHYEYTVDWSGQNFCGLHFDWHYDAGYVDVSMPGYIKAVLHRFLHPQPKSPQFSPHAHVPIKYGLKTRQYALEPDTSPLLDKKGIKYVQQVVGSLLYYARALDGTMLPTLNIIGSEQASPTKQTEQKCKRLLDYAATYSSAFLRYRASNMVLHVDSDAAYLVMPKARSRIAGYYHLLDYPTKQGDINGPLHIECKTLRNVVGSAAEAEMGGLYHNAQTCIPIRYILEALQHPQPPTPIKTDNATAHGFIYNNINLKKSKSWDMKYYWTRDRANQKQFQFIWDYGDQNEGDFWTKIHPTCYQRQMRPKYIKDKLNLLLTNLAPPSNFYNNFRSIASKLQGCVDTVYHRQLRC